MRTSAKLIGAQIIRADDLSVLIGDERLAVRSRPIFEPIVLAHVAGQRVSLSRPDAGLNDLPNCVVIFLRGGPNERHFVLAQCQSP